MRAWMAISTAGKTGTAQIADNTTHNYTHYYNASFMGFAPVADPAIVIVVTANGATGHDGFGAEVSAPVFKTDGGSGAALSGRAEIYRILLPTRTTARSTTTTLLQLRISDPMPLRWIPPTKARIPGPTRGTSGYFCGVRVRSACVRCARFRRVGWSEGA